MSKKEPTVEDLQLELAEVHARLRRHSLVLEQLEKGIDVAKDAANNAYSRADEAWDRIDALETDRGLIER